MYLIEVTDAQQEREFVKLAVELYKENEYWIRPLDKDVRSTFDPEKNPIAKPGTHIRWILKDNQGITIGRIAAFVNKKTAYKKTDSPVGGLGFFECINDEHAAQMLFDAAKHWLKKKGMEAMEGPINFGERDKFWGLLTDGFDREPNYLANYNFPYYKNLFEGYGFRCYFEQYTFSLSTDTNFNPEFINKAKKVIEDPDFEFKHLKKKELDQFTKDFRTIYNQAWAGHLGVSEMTSQKAKAIIRTIKPVLDEKTAWFGYYRDQPIAFFIMIPEVNQLFKYVHGKMNLWGKLIYLYHALRGQNTKLLGIVFGVIPEFDGKGVTNAITYVTKLELNEYRNYKVLEMHGIGDFNPAMIKFVHKLGDVKKAKTHTTYRYLFDREKPFERMPIKKRKRNKTGD